MNPSTIGSRHSQPTRTSAKASSGRLSPCPVSSLLHLALHSQDCTNTNLLLLLTVCRLHSSTPHSMFRWVVNNNIVDHIGGQPLFGKSLKNHPIWWVGGFPWWHVCFFRRKLSGTISKPNYFFYRCPFVPLIKTDKALGWVSLWVVWIIKQVTTLCRLAGRVGQMGRERRLHM